MRSGTAAALALAVVLSGRVILFVAQIAPFHKAEGKSASPFSAHHDTNAMATPDLTDEVVLPSISFSLAAIVRRQPSQKEKEEQKQQQYALVHEKPPRGWWLPGGGIEHKDDTPVDGAIRETVEEAGSTSLLSLLPLSQSRITAKGKEAKLRLLPSMTHLISLQQTPGRIRFIFRGEWIDDGGDCADHMATSKGPRSILKCPPGDEESIESKWFTWDEIQCFEQRKKRKKETGGKDISAASVQCVEDPWLRGHEPLTFYGMLERSWQNNESLPGLPVHMMNVSGEHNVRREEEVGAFFGRLESRSDKSTKLSSLSHHGRAALLVHLKSCLVVYDDTQQRIALDTQTKRFPSSYVKDQNNVTLKELVRGMMKWLCFPSKEKSENQEGYQAGLLRVEHVVHANGREATLTVFPLVCLSSLDGVFLSEKASKRLDWVTEEEVSDGLERKLARAVLVESSSITKFCSLNILRDEEGLQRSE